MKNKNIILLSLCFIVVIFGCNNPSYTVKYNSDLFDTITCYDKSKNNDFITNKVELDTLNFNFLKKN